MKLEGIAGQVVMPTEVATTTAVSQKETPTQGDLTTPPLPPGSVGPPARSQTATTPALLVGRAGGGDVTSERFTLEDAVLSPTFAPRDPVEIPVPAALLAAVRDAESVLLIGHVGPDGDCVGSTLAMARSLRAQGKRVNVCIDGELTGFLRQIDSESEIEMPAALADQSWDLALVMDAGVPGRIGAAADLLVKAGTVAVADHHVVDPKREDFPLADGAGFIRWIEPDYPAATLQAAAIIARLGYGGADRSKVYMPALAGFATDTGWGEYQGLDPEYFRFFKHMLLEGAGAKFEDLVALLSSFALPARLRDLLVPGEASSDTPALPGELAERMATHRSAGEAITEQSFGNDAGETALVMLSCTAVCLATLLEIGRLDDPELIPSDLIGPLKGQRIRKHREAGVKLTAMFTEADNGDIRVSLRSEDDAARHLAEALGGGGHDRAAGAAVTGSSLAEVGERILAWARDEGRIG